MVVWRMWRQRKREGEGEMFLSVEKATVSFHLQQDTDLPVNRESLFSLQRDKRRALFFPTEGIKGLQRKKPKQ